NSVIEYRQNLNDRKLSEVTLGDFRSAYDLSSRFNRVEKDVNDKQGNWDSKPDVDDVEDMVEDGNKWVQDALDDVQDEIDRATQELEDAMIDLDDAMSAADTVFTNKIKSSHNYKGYFSGDVGITGQLHVAGEIYAGSGATFRGTINANNLNLDNANIRNANIRDANITGTLNGVDGNFVGTVLANQIIGNEIAGVTLKTANTRNYLHMRNQILEFWNQDLRKMELGFERWQGESSQSPYIQLGAGDSSNRNRVYMTKREDRFDLAYITSNSGESYFRMTRQGDMRLNARDNVVIEGGGTVDVKNLRADGNRVIRAQSSEDITIATTSSGLVIRRNGSVLGNIYFD